MALVGRSALTGGRGAAFATTWGIVAGCMSWALASAIGLAALLAASATAYDVMRAVGAAYLAWLGLRTFARAGRRAPERPASASRSPFITGLVSNLANPKIVVFYSTVLPTFIPRDAPVLLWSLALAGIHAAEGLVWLSAYAALLSRARGAFERPRVRRAMDRLTGTVLVALGVRLAVER